MQLRFGTTATSFNLAAILTSYTLFRPGQSVPSFSKRDNNPLGIDWYPAPSPQDGPPLSAGALRDPAYLPAEIGGIVGSYALSLVIVALLLLLLAKRRREHLLAGIEEQEDLKRPHLSIPHPGQQINFAQPGSPQSPIKNFSRPTPVDEKDPTPYVYSSPESSIIALGYSAQVDQSVVAADREMAQQQLEEMYRLVMEQEAAKEAGVVLEEPPAPVSPISKPPSKQPSMVSLTKQGILKKNKNKNKPANLDLAREASEKPQSRTASILSALKSPRKKGPKGMNISSPIMTPMSAGFPRQEGEEMEPISPRHYQPASPPPVPMDHEGYAGRTSTRNKSAAPPITPPDISPESTMSIDERLQAQMGTKAHSRNTSQAPSEVDPVSAASENSTTPLVGLPSSPKPGVSRFPSFPSSPKPGATFSRANAPSAVRTGGALPLRAYEPSLASPSMQATKQTTFERAAPLSPSGTRTPYTGTAVPYSPYQPFTPVVPITPTLVTKADRKRMRSMKPKTPTLEMVKSDEEVW